MALKPATQLAVAGGTPVRSTFLPYGHQDIREEDIAAVVSVLRSEWLTTGPTVEEFETGFAAEVGARHAVSYSSGTAALHGAMFAVGIGAGDEVVTSPLSFCATANCVLYQGGLPVFADVEPGTLNLSPERAAAAITSRTRVLLPVDYAGQPAALDAFRRLAEKHDLIVIEDACHALGAEFGGREVGGISHMTVFSFHPVKHIATGEGGMVTTDDEGFARRLRAFRNHGIESDARRRQAAGEWHYEMTELGYNYRLTDIACALGLSQLARLPANLTRRREIARRYQSSLAGLPGLRLLQVGNDVKPAWHLFPVLLDLPRLRAGRAEIFRALRAENIGVNVHYIPVHLHPYYRKRFGDQLGKYPAAEAAYESLLSLPMFHAMTDSDVSDVVAAIEKVLLHYAGK